MNVFMLREFNAGPGFWITFVAIGLDFAAGVHLFWTKRQVSQSQLQKPSSMISLEGRSGFESREEAKEY